MNAPLAFAAGKKDTVVDSRLSVPGIRCAGCIAKIERGLGRLEGVEDARVNFSAKRVAVRHLASLDDQTLIEELSRLGFESGPAPAVPRTAEDREAKPLLRALAVAGFGMMNIMLLSVSVWSGAEGGTRDLFHWLSALIALPVVAYSGRPFFTSAARALRNRTTNMDVPISIGVLLATGMSLFEVLTGGEHAYFDGAVMLLFFLLAGRALDATMRNRTRAGIGALLSRMGKSAAVIADDGSTRRIPATDLVPGMVMAVAAGDALAADGRVMDGHGTIDNAMLTGETAPEPVGPGDVIHAGSVALDGPMTVEITATQADTAIAEIARMMDEAGQSRSRYVRIADRASRLYAPAVHSLAVFAFVGWMVAGAGWHQAMVIAISVLIITCPCAMGLAVPAAQVVSSGALLRKGLLVKDGTALERLAEIDIALFDKTGTLTLGQPVPDLSGLDKREQAIALALAQTSSHPLSKGLVAALQSVRIVPARLAAVRETAGRGVIGTVDGIEVALKRPQARAGNLATALWIGDEERDIRFEDTLRSDARETIRALATMGVRSEILSGDRDSAVGPVASMLEVKGSGGISPADKLARLEALRALGYHPLMIGDGLNDGPALAAAHASIAPATASDASQQAADAVFVGERLMPVALAVKGARATMRIVRQNFGFAIGYNILAVPLAVAGMVTPLIAAIAMSTSSLVVVVNSLRLARIVR